MGMASVPDGSETDAFKTKLDAAAGFGAATYRVNHIALRIRRLYLLQLYPDFRCGSVNKVQKNTI